MDDKQKMINNGKAAWEIQMILQIKTTKARPKYSPVSKIFDN